MDRTVPPGAAMLLDFIRRTEVGTAEPRGYDVIYANKQALLPKPITRMTVAELHGHQSKGWPAKSTASGGYQFMRATLAGLRKELGLRDGQIFDPDLQDRLGFHLLKRRGYDSFTAGRISRSEFGKRLAKEWASFPVLAATQGAHRMLARGQSYYAGDGLNKALVRPETVEAVLNKVKGAGSGVVAPRPAAPSAAPATTAKPAPLPKGSNQAVAWTFLLLLIAGALVLAFGV